MGRAAPVRIRATLETRSQVDRIHARSSSPPIRTPVKVGLKRRFGIDDSKAVFRGGVFDHARFGVTPISLGFSRCNRVARDDAAAMVASATATRFLKRSGVSLVVSLTWPRSRIHEIEFIAIGRTKLGRCNSGKPAIWENSLMSLHGIDRCGLVQRFCGGDKRTRNKSEFARRTSIRIGGRLPR